MKLYTEDQMIQAYESGRGLTHEEVLDQFVPIQIPTDEEMKKSVEWLEHPLERIGWKAGVQWMRDKIKGGEK